MIIFLPEKTRAMLFRTKNACRMHICLVMKIGNYLTKFVYCCYQSLDIHDYIFPFYKYTT